METSNLNVKEAENFLENITDYLVLKKKIIKQYKVKVSDWRCKKWNLIFNYYLCMI
jgi:hypothetical protein